MTKRRPAHQQRLGSRMRRASPQHLDAQVVPVLLQSGALAPYSTALCRPDTAPRSDWQGSAVSGIELPL